MIVDGLVHLGTSHFGYAQDAAAALTGMAQVGTSVALAVPVFDQRGRIVAALNSSSHSKKISKAKLVRERLEMLQQLSQQISADLRGLPGLSLSATV